MEYRLNKTSESINKFISDYAKERGIDVAPPSSNKRYDHLLITNGGRICYCSDVYMGATPIGIDDFLSKIDELAKPKFTIAGHAVKFYKDHVTVGCEYIPNKLVKSFIKEFTKQPLPEKQYYVGGDFFLTEHDEIYMLVYSSGRTLQLVCLNGGNRYMDPMYVQAPHRMTKQEVEQLAGGRKLTYIQNPYM